jgi:hypothetical protein
VNICNNSCIGKVDECVIYESVIDGTGVEDSEVGVFDARGMEVWVGVSTSVQSHAIDRVSFLATSLNSHTISNQDVANILSYLSLPQLIAKEELVMSWIGAVIEHPVITRVVSIFLSLHTSINNTELRGSGDKKHRCFIGGAFTIRVDKVDEGWYPG